MRLGGWSRLGVVLSVLYGLLVVIVAYAERPRVEWLHDAWFDEASRAIAAAISNADGREVTPHQVRDRLLRNGDNENIAWLEKVASTPSQKQESFSSAVKQVNEKHKALIDKLPERILRHAGLLREHRVTSKWGDGSFFEHGIYEVPENYGSDTQCYYVPSPSRIETEFLSYAALRGAR